MSFYTENHNKNINTMKMSTFTLILLTFRLSFTHNTASAQVKKSKDKIEQPQYPGGIKALHKFIASEIRYPAEARRDNILGEVIVGFTVGVDGHLTGIRVLKSVSEALDKEAVRVISKTGYWYPGKKNGKPVRFEMSIPINFKVLIDLDKYVNEDEDGINVRESDER